jgi:glyoxylase-like metal-dependent hydrolase (beta-lactamase superfamily II)
VYQVIKLLATEGCEQMPETLVEKIRDNLFRAEIPLPRNPLKATNSYIIKSEKRNLVIDTGMNRDECKNALTDAFRQLDIDLQQTDFFVTHLHADHIGLVDELSADDAVIYFNEPDAAILNRNDLWQLVQSLAGKHGFPEDLVNAAIDSHPGQRYSPKNPVGFTMVRDGDLIFYADYELQCIATPGHTGGHTCLYEPHQKLFFSGDHILGDITPNISTWLEAGNPLKEYFDSLDRVYKMEINLVLPGHRNLIKDCRVRINQLKEHHRQRLVEVLKILEETGPGSAFEVASHMTWDLVAASWDAFPLMQKWFATGEALAHLHFLETEGKLKRELKDGRLYFASI